MLLFSLWGKDTICRRFSSLFRRAGSESETQLYFIAPYALNTWFIIVFDLADSMLSKNTAKIFILLTNDFAVLLQKI